MSDKKGSCSPGQTPKVKQTDGSGTLTMEVLGRIFMIVFFFLIEFFVGNSWRRWNLYHISLLSDSCIDKPTGSSGIYDQQFLLKWKNENKKETKFVLKSRIL